MDNPVGGENGASAKLKEPDEQRGGLTYQRTAISGLNIPEGYEFPVIRGGGAEERPMPKHISGVPDEGWVYSGST